MMKKQIKILGKTYTINGIEDFEYVKNDITEHGSNLFFPYIWVAHTKEGVNIPAGEFFDKHGEFESTMRAAGLWHEPPEISHADDTDWDR